MPASSPASAAAQVRRAGHIEGASLLVLFLVAMPLKYLAGYPLAVTIVGWIHGVLFVWFCWVLARAFFGHRWPFLPTAALLVLAVVPFGFLAADRLLAGKAFGTTESAG